MSYKLGQHVWLVKVEKAKTPQGKDTCKVQEGIVLNADPHHVLVGSIPETGGYEIHPTHMVFATEWEAVGKLDKLNKALK